MSDTVQVESIFFFNDTATTEIYTLSLHDALPISATSSSRPARTPSRSATIPGTSARRSSSSRASRSCFARPTTRPARPRSEEHTSELQSRQYLVCRLLLEKKKKYTSHIIERNRSH